MQSPILHVFLISHYCEKARWALDLCGIDYQVNLLSPLAHAKTAKTIGADRSALPILQTASEVIQGSADILYWANNKATEKHKPRLHMTPESIEIEKRLDDVLGIHVRRWFYSESLLDCPQTVKPVFAEGANIIGRMMLNLAWPKVVDAMIKRMDLGFEQEQESKVIVEAELDWLDSLVSANGDFLFGEELSNADIAAASLIAPIVNPANHPASETLVLPPRVSDTAEKWRSRPFAKWVSKMYQENR